MEGHTILIRGGSIASGEGVGRGYAERIQPLCSRRGFRVVNRSRAGDTSFDGVWTFDSDVSPWRPDILILHFGVEDAFSPVYRSEFKENLVRMVKAARREADPVIILPTSHVFDDPYEMDAVNIYYRTIREVCTDLGCVMAAVHTWWAGYCRRKGVLNKDLVKQDARLPNDKGHAVIARALLPSLMRAMDKTAGGIGQKV